MLLYEALAVHYRGLEVQDSDGSDSGCQEYQEKHEKRIVKLTKAGKSSTKCG